MMTSPANTQDITRTIFAVLFIGGLIAGSLWVLRPFLPAVIWATMIVVASWPVLLRLQEWLWGQRWLADAVMTCVLLLVLVVPLSLAIGTIVSNVQVITGWAGALSTVELPQPPDWLSTIPFIGKRAAQAWTDLAALGREDLAKKLAPYAGAMVSWFVLQIGGFGMMAVQFVLTVVVSAILFATGETAAENVRHFGRRLAGVQGESTVILAGKAIRGVALGVVVTAFVQAILGGIGLVMTGVPFAAILTAIMFMLAVAQVGAGLIMLSGIIWLFWTGSIGWGLVLVVWSILIGPVLKNILRPILIKKGADLPLLLVLAGVLGGLIAFGLVGIFIGPMMLAVSYRLLQAWMNEELSEPAAVGEHAQEAG
jgi:predicted PurR-regulated permease PerM